MINKNLSDEDYIETLYEVMMDRTADESGMNTWKETLAGGVSRKFVFRGFAQSDEFTSICKDYGIVRGYVKLTEGRDRNEGAARFVARLYTQALGRGFDVKGMNDWCNAICNGERSAYYVATEGFFHSREFMNRNLNNSDFVEVLYETYLGRASDPAGKAEWVSRLDKGEMSRDDVMKGFAYSPEFKNIMKSYGL